MNLLYHIICKETKVSIEQKIDSISMVGKCVMQKEAWIDDISLLLADFNCNIFITIISIVSLFHAPNYDQNKS